MSLVDQFLQQVDNAKIVAENVRLMQNNHLGNGVRIDRVTLSAYFLSSVDNPTMLISSEYYGVLFCEWRAFLSNNRGRQFLRVVIVDVFCKRGMLDMLAANLDRECQQLMRRSYPDLFHAIYAPTLAFVDLELLDDVEDAYQKLYCRKTPSQERLIEASVESALEIDFFERVWALNLKWNMRFHERVSASEWAIPPQSQGNSTMWYVPRHTFEQRLEWLCPGIGNFLRSSELRRVGAVLSGSIVPLCILKHGVCTDNEHDFVAFANEVYRGFSVDIFVCKQEVTATTMDFVRGLSEVGRHLQNTWVCQRKVEWAEDDDAWTMRNRRGITYYYGNSDNDRVQLVVMGHHARKEAISQQHLPCVRAYYDGSAVKVTASCLISWMTRFVDEKPLFGNKITQQRKSKTVFKYATRGWGFSALATSQLQLPSTLHTWLQEWNRKQPLPCYHPLYNPSQWHKWMSEERVQSLRECVEI